MPYVDAAPAQESVGARIRRLRLQRGLTQRELSEPGASYAYLSRIEAGHRAPSVKALRILARKLRVPVEYLETGEAVPGVVSRDLRLGDAELALRLESGDPAIADTFRALLGEAHEASDEAAILRARIGLGLALAAKGEYREAVTHLENATASPAVTPQARPDVYATLGRCYASVGETQRAVSLFEHCLGELGEGDRALRIRFTSYLSCALADRGDLEGAREVLADVADRVEEELDTTGRVHLYWSQARISSMEGETVAAMTYMRRALGLLEASEDTLELARAHLHCAEILLLEGQAEQAGPHIDRADLLFELGADHRDLGALRTQQAHRAVLLGDAEGAIALGREAVDYLDEHVVDQGSAWHVLGLAQAAHGEAGAAIESFEKAVEQLEQGGEWREALGVYRAWARALQSLGREQDALDAMERATLVRVRFAGVP